MAETEKSYPYVTHLNVFYKPLELVDVPALVAACTDRWYNQTLCRVNDSVVRLGVVEGEYHWHKHDDEDEFFYVVEGQFPTRWTVGSDCLWHSTRTRISKFEFPNFSSWRIEHEPGNFLSSITDAIC